MNPPPSPAASDAALPLRAPSADATSAPARPGSARELFLAFSWMALQGFGGVMAVVQRELVERRRWLGREAFVEDWAVAQVLPGPNVVNLALMIGDRYFGLRGAVAALAGLIAAPLVLLVVLVLGFTQVHDLPEVRGALRGMGAVAAGLIVATALKLVPALRRNVLGGAVSALLGALAFVAIVFGRVPLPWVLAVLGLPACALAAWRLRGEAAT